jgi:aspartate aminotransferase, mitochondrial
MKLAYGDDADVLVNKQVAAVQALSGTGACRLMAEFQRRYLPGSKVLIPKPTWSNHHNIWRDAGVQKAEFRYYDPKTQGLDFDGITSDLEVRPRQRALGS